MGLGIISEAYYFEPYRWGLFIVAAASHHVRHLHVFADRSQLGCFHRGIKDEPDWICSTSDGQEPSGQSQVVVICDQRARHSFLPSIYSLLNIYFAPLLISPVRMGTVR